MIEITNLNKSFGKFQALDNLCMKVNEGDVYGFVGPNGAGKTTTMKIMTGLLFADSGRLIIDGIDARKDSVELKSRIGYVPDFFGTYDNLKVREYMDFFADIYGVDRASTKKLIDKYLDMVNLLDKEDTYVDSMSRGMKQRLCLARALIHNPAVLILDEPASGLDPRARFEFKEIIKELKGLGKTIIVSSHILPELAQMSTRIGIIEAGKIIVEGSVDEIMTSISGNSILSIEILNNHENAIKLLKADDTVNNIIIDGNFIRLSYNGDETTVAELVKKLVVNDVSVIGVDKNKADLEEIFLRVTKDYDDFLKGGE